MNDKNKKSVSPRVKRSIIKDPVSPESLSQLNLQFCCEQCTHFKTEDESCTLGYNAKNHLRRTNLASYEQSGRMALCRFMEID